MIAILLGTAIGVALGLVGAYWTLTHTPDVIHPL